MSNSKRFLQTKLQFGIAKSTTVTDSNVASIEQKVEQLKLGKRKGRSCSDCRGLCTCSYCDGNHDDSRQPSEFLSAKSPRQLQFYGKRLKQPMYAEPPQFTRISLLYSEEETWIRLQIREFLYRFGNICQLEARVIASLQNVQGDWRFRRLSALLVWQALLFIGEGKRMNNDNNSGFVNENVQRMARKIIKRWSLDLGLDRSIFSNDNERWERTGELLSQKGMSCSRWQDVAELLAAARFHPLPVPTIAGSACTVATNPSLPLSSSSLSPSSSSSTSVSAASANDMITSSKEEGQEGDSDSDGDSQQHKVDRFRGLKRSPLSTKDELHLVQMVLDILLMDGSIRQQMADMAKDIKSLEEELRNSKKSFGVEDLQQKSLANQLSEKANTYQVLGRLQTSTEFRQQLDQLRATILLKQKEMDKKTLEIMVSKSRCDKRLQRLVTPWDKNEYWLFHDLLTPQQHYDSSNSSKSIDMEPFWAYGVIIIGVCPMGNDNNRKWWHISGIESIQKLDKWLNNSLNNEQRERNLDGDILDMAERDIKMFRLQLVQRIEYLRLLERIVYGDGYFR